MNKVRAAAAAASVVVTLGFAAGAQAAITSSNITSSVQRQMSDDRGYAVSSLAELGDGPGFRKIRAALGVDAFGVNAIVLPPGYATNLHFHDEQQELYFVHTGEVEIRFGDGTTHHLGPGGLARVDATTHRGMRNVGDSEAIVLITGGKDGYVERDGHTVDES